MTTLFQATPTRFIASGGKLDSVNRYVFQNNSPVFYFTQGRSLQIEQRAIRYSLAGHVRALGPSISFTGSYIGMSL